MSKKPYGKTRKKNSSSCTLADLESYLRNEPLAKEKVKRIDSPVRIHIHSKRKRLADADGVSAKALIDGLVLGGVLSDDSPREVTAVTYSQEKV